MPNAKPAISVVIPAYNEEEYLPRCLASLAKQTFRDFEIIVVDNNSTDKTATIAANYGARVVAEKIQGMTPARERGFKEAQAEIIVRTDADSILPINWLAKIYQIFSGNEKIAGFAGSHTIQNNLFVKILFESYMSLFFYLTRLLMGHYQFSGANYALRKSAWEKIKNEIHQDDSLVHEDMDIACHLAKVGNIEFHPEIKTVFSFRRFRKKFLYTILEYAWRSLRTIWLHHPFFRREQNI